MAGPDYNPPVSRLDRNNVLTDNSYAVRRLRLFFSVAVRGRNTGLTRPSAALSWV
jgi:hypothetical protein